MQPPFPPPSTAGRPDPRPAEPAESPDSVDAHPNPPSRPAAMFRMLRAVRRVGSAMTTAHRHRVPF